MKISVVIVAYNEEKNISICLDSVKWADEIVVVDNESSDKTAEIVKKYTSHVYHHKRVGYVEPVRNFAISKATGDWILLLDADEVIPPTLQDKLRRFTKEAGDITHVYIPRKNIIFNKWIEHTGWWPDHLIRFFKKGSVEWKEEIHSIPQVKGESFTLQGEENAIVHQNYQSIRQFVHKNLENYAEQEAKELLQKGYVFTYSDIIRFPVGEFLSRYFAREGYKDGFHGLVLSLLMATYHFVMFLYIWEQKDFVALKREDVKHELQDEVKQAQKEFAFWISKKTIEEEKSHIKKIGIKLKRKLNL